MGAPNADELIEVRRLGLPDLALLMSAPDGVFDDPVVPVRAAEFLGDARHVLIAALDHEVIVGFASAVIYVHPDKQKPELWINEVGVAASHQRRGLGRRLMAKATAEARAAGCSVVWVQTEADNAPAQALYRACGARETSGVVHYEIKLP